MEKRLIATCIMCVFLIVGCASEKQTPSDNNLNVDIVEESDAKEKSLYEKFLSNEACVEISRHVDNDSYFAFEKIEGEELTLKELVKKLITYDNSEDGKLWLDGISYAYIDCGNDEQKELAIQIKTPMQAEGWCNYFIIKEIDGKLKTVYSGLAWNRNSIYFNEYGYIYCDGSGGAANHYFDKSYVDVDGIWHFIYSDATELIAVSEEYEGIGAISGFYELSDEEIEKYKGEYILIDFNFSEPDPYNSEEYEEGDGIHTYAKVIRDDEFANSNLGYRGYCYCNLEDNYAIYEEDSPLIQYYGGDGFCTLDEIEKMIADKESEEGLTETIKNGADIIWNELEINFEL